MRWQLNLYKDIAMRSEGPTDPDRVVDRIQRISAAVFNLEQVSRWILVESKSKNSSESFERVNAASASFQVEQPLRSKKCVWQKLLSKQRKRAVVACFRMAPLYNLPR